MNSVPDRMPAERLWLGLHLYATPGTRRANPVRLASVILSLLSGSHPPPMFFVRYRDEFGAHVRIRLRFGNASDLANAKQIIDQRLATGYIREPGGTTGDTLLRYEPYQPEFERYGGVHAIAVSEDHFCFSSEWLLSHLDEFGSSHPQRTALAAACIIQAVPLMAGRQEHIIACTEEMVRRHHARCLARSSPENAPELGARRHWQDNKESYVRLLSWLTNGSLPLNHPLWNWQSGIERSNIALQRVIKREDEASRRRILGTWMHMHCNRIGLSREEEYHIIYAINRALRHG